LKRPGFPDRDALFKAIAKKEIPLEKIGRPEDVAGPALFLASGLSDYVTGQVINVAGGQPLLSHAATFNIEAYLKSLADILVLTLVIALYHFVTNRNKWPP
jgi:hypothetical protein